MSAARQRAAYARDLSDALRNDALQLPDGVIASVSSEDVLEPRFGSGGAAFPGLITPGNITSVAALCRGPGHVTITETGQVAPSTNASTVLQCSGPLNILTVPLHTKNGGAFVLTIEAPSDVRWAIAAGSTVAS